MHSIISCSAPSSSKRVAHCMQPPKQDRAGGFNSTSLIPLTVRDQPHPPTPTHPYLYAALNGAALCGCVLHGSLLHTRHCGCWPTTAHSNSRADRGRRRCSCCCLCSHICCCCCCGGLGGSGLAARLAVGCLLGCLLASTGGLLGGRWLALGAGLGACGRVGNACRWAGV